MKRKRQLSKRKQSFNQRYGRNAWKRQHKRNRISRGRGGKKKR